MYLRINTCCWIVQLLVIYINCCCGLDILEFVFGPRLGHPPRLSPKNLDFTSAQNLIEQHNYPFENHEVTSDSGHILIVHRIPYGIKRKSRPTQRPVALFQHGLFAATDTWLFKGPDENLPFILADAGYDVWLSNMRGNTYSRKHKTLNPDRDKEYWMFGLEDVAYYDLPAIIDYILSLTNQKSLYYLGHSIGSTVGFILCSVRPEYNSKIKLHLALAPLVYATHSLHFTHQMVATVSSKLYYTLLSENIYGIFPRRAYIGKLLKIFCSDGVPTQPLCLTSLFLFVGPDYELFNTSDFTSIANYFPSGTSVYLSIHTTQIYTRGVFGSLDYGEARLNSIKYNTTLAPTYNLSKISSPVSLHYGKGDWLVPEEDMDYLEKQLPNSVGKFPVPHENFNHMDFMWGIGANNLLYERLIVLMNKFR